MTSLFDVIGGLYKANNPSHPDNNGIRVFVNQGGTSSGKTFTIMQIFIEMALHTYKVPRVWTVIGQDLPNLKVGSFRDAQTILYESEFLQKCFKVNKSETTITCVNGNIIEFKAYEDEQDAKNGKRDYAFFNEANGVSWDVYRQIAMRTKHKIWIDYNPSERFWVHDRLIGKPEVRLIISDHRMNCFLAQDVHDRIENDKDDLDFWFVYARGLTGKLKESVYTNWEICDSLPKPDECKWRIWGLDFGFSADNTACIDVRYSNGELWLRQEFYEKGMTNDDIYKECHLRGIGKRGDFPLIADSAEPKSIRELQKMGLEVVGCVKGNDSIRNGIDIVKRYKMHVHRQSTELIAEFKNYKYKKDRDGNITNQPVDKFNHLLDALRYVCSTKLKAGATKGNKIRRGVRKRN